MNYNDYTRMHCDFSHDEQIFLIEIVNNIVVEHKLTELLTFELMKNIFNDIYVKHIAKVKIHSDALIKESYDGIVCNKIEVDIVDAVPIEKYIDIFNLEDNFKMFLKDYIQCTEEEF